MKFKGKRAFAKGMRTWLKVFAWLTVGVTVAMLAIIGMLAGPGTSGDPARVATAASAAAYSLPVPAGASPNVKAAVDAAWPKVLAACPGLLRYGADLTYQGIEDNEAHAGPTARRISILMRVADNPAQIPDAYMAQGHTCQFEISAGGQALTIQKRPCAALCRDDAAMLGNLAETVVGLR